MKLAIFDLDGTLLDTIDDLGDSCNHVLQQNNYPIHEIEKYKYFVGDGIRKLIERAIPQEVMKDVKQVDAVEAAFRKHYDLNKTNKTGPYHGLIPVLEKLQARNVQIAVATNKAHPLVAPLLEYYFPTIHFNAAIGQRSGKPVKPNPYIIYEILEQTKTDKSEAIYIGDTSVDMQTGKNAELFTIGVLWGFRPKEELLQYGADAIIETPDELLNY
ncbi:MAG TPA: HAD family hydrolase [Bacteroidales bacterium]|jgi:phosphoglycolate phosphatase|nr:HAD family hydrolase [Bacteroidales bacterium]HOS57246.1 HAD family hydrolase [Bacteroidales bacterium]HRR03709.1 HAD family hydrolase [Bacteroidales bacterium]HRT13932.1 HAD family hydrolase [Bacteroidales bacterium]